MAFLLPWRKPHAPHDDSLPPFPDRVLDESSEPPVFKVPRCPVVTTAAAMGTTSDFTSAESLEKELPALPEQQRRRRGLTLPGWLILPKERYLGLPRRTVMLIVLGAVLLLALVLGLSIGLSVGRGKSDKKQITPSTSGALQTGDGTFYEPGLGACGISSSASDNIVAVSHIIFDAVQVGANPNNNPLCGRKIWVTREKSPGKNVSLEVEVVDRCTGCKASDLDFSLTVFEKLADEWQGRVLISWAWVI